VYILKYPINERGASLKKPSGILRLPEPDRKYPDSPSRENPSLIGINSPIGVSLIGYFSV
jgi:hypothetical protein